jgi:hypothetical protein
MYSLLTLQCSKLPKLPCDYRKCPKLAKTSNYLEGRIFGLYSLSWKTYKIIGKKDLQTLLLKLASTSNYWEESFSPDKAPEVSNHNKLLGRKFLQTIFLKLANKSNYWEESFFKLYS